MSDFKPVKLKRSGHWPMVLKAILREDGVHFIDHDGKEREKPGYPSIEEMNKTLKSLNFPEFEVDKEK